MPRFRSLSLMSAAMFAALFFNACSQPQPAALGEVREPNHRQCAGRAFRTFDAGVRMRRA